MKPQSLLLLIIVFFCVPSFAQDKSSYKFGAITAADFSPKSYSIDSNAAAVILADVGSTGFEGNKKGWFTLIFKRHTRIRILKNTASDLATVIVHLYKKDDNSEKLEDVKASTYNEAGGSVVETMLDKHDIFEEKLDKNNTQKKFTMPAVKEGSIIDIAYTIRSDYDFNLQPWTFQHLAYPCLWSEYNISVPGILNYIFLRQGVHKYYIEKKGTESKVYRVTLPSDHGSLVAPDRDLVVSTTDIKYKWVLKDLPGFPDEDYVSCPENYLDKIEFQLSQVSTDGENVRDVRNTWPKIAEEMLTREDFAGALAMDNYWLDKDMEAIGNDLSDDLNTAKKIYDFVKNNYTCTGNGYFIKTRLYDVFKNRKGNNGEINLILMAMFRKKGIPVDPVLVSTRSNGRPYDSYPLLSKYNYVFCRANIKGSFYNLDACHPFLGFGILDNECYNGKARVINQTGDSFDLPADSLKENKTAYVVITPDKNGGFKGVVDKMPGYYESYHLRESIAKSGKGGVLNEIGKGFPTETRVDNIRIDSLTNLGRPLLIHFDFSINADEAKTIYLNPLFGEGYEKNLFKSEDRVLPVEMFFPANRTYMLNMEIPEGYSIDELPKPMKLKLNQNGDGVFEYLIQQDDKRISLRTKLVINRTFFSADEYDSLREFFNLIVKKQNENIVLKKS